MHKLQVPGSKYQIPNFPIGAWILGLGTWILTIALAGLSAHAAVNVEGVFKTFWDTATTASAEKATHAIAESGIDFDTAYARLKAGRPYAKEKSGLIRLPTIVNGESFETLLENHVPKIERRDS